MLSRRSRRATRARTASRRAPARATIVIVPSCASSATVARCRRACARAPRCSSGVTSALRICPPSRPISIRTKSSATRNHLRENAVDGLGMDERDLETEETPPRLRSISCAPVGLELVERRAKVVRSRGRRGASRAHAARGTARPACPRRSASRAPRGPRRRGSTRPRRPARRAARDARAAPRRRSYVAIASSRSVTATPR